MSMTNDDTRISAIALAERVSQFALPVFMVALLILAWQWLSAWFEVPVYIAPRPSQFLFLLWTDFGELAVNAWATTWTIVGGFLIGAVIAIPLAYAIVTLSWLERGLFPLIVFLQLIPKTITAPLFLVWFGFGIAPKLGLTTVLTFFPILVDSIAGFRSVDPRLMHIPRSMGATGWQTLRLIQVPAAMPYIFSGLKIASVYAVTAVMVVEFVGSQQGLGYLMLHASSYMDTPLMFACVLVVSLIGVAFSLSVSLLEWLMMPWKRHLAQP